MKLPATIISGDSLKNRWSMTDRGIVLMMIKHDLRIMTNYGGMFPYEHRDPDDSLVLVSRDGIEGFPFEVAEVSEYQFSLEDVERIEQENTEAFFDRANILTIDQVSEKWGKTTSETIDIINNTSGIMPVDPIGGYFDHDTLIYYMDALQYINTTYMMYLEDDIRNIESQFSIPPGKISPEMRAVIEDQPSRLCFYKNGEIWKIGPENQEVDFTDIDGFKYIRFLLLSPNEDIDVMEVYHLGNAPEEVKQSSDKIPYNPRLDSDAIKQISEELEDLQDRLEVSEDIVEQEQLENKINQFKKVLQFSSKKIDSGKEKVRVNVRKAIKRAVDEIKKMANDYVHLNIISQHINLNKYKPYISTGLKCSYKASVESSVKWILDPPT